MNICWREVHTGLRVKTFNRYVELLKELVNLFFTLNCKLLQIDTSTYSIRDMNITTGYHGWVLAAFKLDFIQDISNISQFSSTRLMSARTWLWKSADRAVEFTENLAGFRIWMLSRQNNTNISWLNWKHLGNNGTCTWKGAKNASSVFSIMS